LQIRHTRHDAALNCVTPRQVSAEPSIPRHCSNMVTRRRTARGEAMSIRPVKSIIQSQPTIEGAGVKLRRAFGFGNTGDFDPFLLLYDFRNEHPQAYLAGLPWPPQRGTDHH